MKQFITLLLVFLSLSCFSQQKDINLISQETKEDILSDTLLMYFSQKINLNLNDYQILPLCSIVDTTSFFKKNNTKLKVVSRKIYYDSLSDYSLVINENSYTYKRKKSLKTKFLSCYRSLETNSDNKFFIEFYSIE